MFAGKTNCVLGCGDGLRDQVTSTSLTAAAVAVPSVICAGLPNGRDGDGVGRAPKCFGLDSHLSTQDRFKV